MAKRLTKEIYWKRLIERFWNHVEKTPTCWVWTGTMNQHGYGRISMRDTSTVAHRFAYELIKGVKLPHETVLMHTCDNTSCVNPDHLIPGTQKENLEDMRQKERQRDYSQNNVSGEKNGSCKTPETTIIAILQDHRAGMSYNKLVIKYGLRKTQIARIVTGQSWHHVSHPISEYE